MLFPHHGDLSWKIPKFINVGGENDWPEAVARIVYYSRELLFALIFWWWFFLHSGADPTPRGGIFLKIKQETVVAGRYFLFYLSRLKWFFSGNLGGNYESLTRPRWGAVHRSFGCSDEFAGPSTMAVPYSCYLVQEPTKNDRVERYRFGFAAGWRVGNLFKRCPNTLFIACWWKKD